MKVVELLQEDILTLKNLLSVEIRDNKIKIDNIKNNGNEEWFCLMKSLKDRNKMLNKIKTRLNKAKKLPIIDEIGINEHFIRMM